MPWSCRRRIPHGLTVSYAPRFTTVRPLFLSWSGNTVPFFRIGTFSTIAVVCDSLVYRVPSKRVNITVVTDKTTYSVGDTVTLSVTATTAEEGRPVNGDVYVSVIDDTVLQSTPTRLSHPRLPAMALLEHDVMHFDDPGAYNVLPSVVKDSRSSIDLLLGTQVPVCSVSLVLVSLRHGAMCRAGDDLHCSRWRTTCLEAPRSQPRVGTYVFLRRLWTVFMLDVAQLFPTARKFTEKEFGDKLQSAFEVNKARVNRVRYSPLVPCSIVQALS